MVTRESYVSVRTARLFLRQIGEGSSLVVLHGGPEFDHTYLLPELDLLADGLEVVFYDQRGRGRSADGVTVEDVSLGSEIEDIEAVRAQLGADRIAILGHSWGGLLAAEYAVRHPDRLTHLVFMNSAPLSHASLVSFREHRRRLRGHEVISEMERIAATPEFRAGEIAAEAAFNRLHFAAAVSDRELRNRVVSRLRTHFTPETVLLARAIEERLSAESWADPGYDVLRRLGGLRVPTMVIGAENDFIPRSVAVEIAGTVPGARLAELSGCGHFPYAERPREVADLVLDFILNASPKSVLGNV